MHSQSLPAAKATVLSHSATLGRLWEGSVLTAVTVPVALVSTVIKKNVLTGCCPPSQPWSVQTVSTGLSLGMTRQFGTVLNSPRQAACVLCSRPPLLCTAVLLGGLWMEEQKHDCQERRLTVGTDTHGATVPDGEWLSRNHPHHQDPGARAPLCPAQLRLIWPHSPVSLCFRTQQWQRSATC